MNILLTSGGSIGHIAPLVAVWRVLKELHPEAQAHVVCADRPEEIDFCRAEGLAATSVPRPRLGLGLPLALLQSYRIATKTIATFKPDVVFCKGGAVSIPVCFAAKRAGIPIVLHESDAVMGRANRLLSTWAQTLCLGSDFAASKLNAQRSKLAVTGNPVRPDITRGSREKGLKITGFSGNRPVLLILGGSQGAQAINEAVALQIDALTACCDIVHITGPGKAGATPRSGYYVVPFAQQELSHLYAIASLAVTRAGAGSLAELAACGIPAIIIPIEGLAQNHQVLNARAARGCVLPQEKIGILAVQVRSLLENSDARKEITPVAGGGDAARRIAEIVAQSVASGRRNA